MGRCDADLFRQRLDGLLHALRPSIIAAMPDYRPPHPVLAVPTYYAGRAVALLYQKRHSPLRRFSRQLFPIAWRLTSRGYYWDMRRDWGKP